MAELTQGNGGGAAIDVPGFDAFTTTIGLPGVRELESSPRTDRAQSS